MSASILFEPVNPRPNRIGCWVPSFFQEAMERAGMGLPCTLRLDHIPILQGMSAVFQKEKTDSPNPFLECIEAINKYGEINVWAEH